MSSTMTTPQRPLPGAFLATPAPSRPAENQVSITAPPSAPVPPQLTAVERAAKTINETLEYQRQRFPQLDAYIHQGISADYATHASFQRVKRFDIPNKILEQFNNAQLTTMMGLFADLNHAWVSIDSSLYLWDYTNPDPEIIGFEEQYFGITAVNLVKPKPGVFIPAITRVLVITTKSDILLVGLSAEQLPTGQHKVILYQTKMAASVRGLDITQIVGDDKTGRIFFSGADNNVYELYYQQEERWFYNKCWKVNHTSALGSSLVNFNFAKKDQPERAQQLVAESSRNRLFSLSTKSTIRVFELKPGNKLDLKFTMTFDKILQNIGHMCQPTILLDKNTSVASISSIPSTESTKLQLVATTNTGCRIYLSFTSYGEGYYQKSSMQVHHVRFPPSRDIVEKEAFAPSNAPPATIPIDSRSLTTSRNANVFSPGYFFDFVSTEPNQKNDVLFFTAPDSGQLARQTADGQALRFLENGLWLALDGRAEDIGLVTPPFAASDSPVGFANELAVQHDQATTEIAILTNTGVTTLRRLRLVDEFAAAVRLGRGGEGLETSVKGFIRLYGRSETAASALAVACGQGLDVSNDARVASITDPDILDGARTAFIEYGGRAQLNENSLVDQSVQAIDMVKPSPRHDGLALYVSRLVRSLWKAKVTTQQTTPSQGLLVTSTISTQKLQDVQQDLNALKEFLEKNKSFIDGLGGPDTLARVYTKHEEIALQGEHRAMYALITLVTNIIEGIAFVQMLFGERIEEIVMTLDLQKREQVQNLTYEDLFCTASGRELAKDLVKAIVNRNIQAGHNVDTVAESLRRRCGSFCSASDVVIFKSQELLKRAAEKAPHDELGRNLLNESLRLFKSVVDSLTFVQLQDAVEQYIRAHFYGGAIELVLRVAKEKDRGNLALQWIEAGRVSTDPGRVIFEEREQCYKLVQIIINSLDAMTIYKDGQTGERDFRMESSLRSEAQEIIDTSDDEVFQITLYDWYLSMGQADKLLEIQSPYLVRYLQRKAKDDINIADLLWRYHTQMGRLFEAAKVQLDLAQSDFKLNLDRRIEYLSRAKANASTYSGSAGRSSRQKLLRDITESLEVATIQSDVVQALRDEERLVGDRREKVLADVDGRLMGLGELYNGYADNAGYYDICILIYQAAGHRVPTDIRSTWQNLFAKVHGDAESGEQMQPFEAICDIVRRLGGRLNLSEVTFPVNELLPMLKKYAFESQRGIGPEHWVVDLFLDVGVPHETVYTILQGMLYNDEAPFHGANRQPIANDILYVSQKWFRDTRSGRPFGSDQNASDVMETLQVAVNNGLSQGRVQECQELRARISQLLN